MMTYLHGTGRILILTLLKNVVCIAKLQPGIWGKFPFCRTFTASDLSPFYYPFLRLSKLLPSRREDGRDTRNHS